MPAMRQESYELRSEERLQFGFFEGFEAVFFEDGVDLIEGDHRWSKELDSNELPFLVDIEDHPGLDSHRVLALFLRVGEIQVADSRATISIADSQIDVAHFFFSQSS